MSDCYVFTHPSIWTVAAWVILGFGLASLVQGVTWMRSEVLKDFNNTPLPAPGPYDWKTEGDG